MPVAKRCQKYRIFDNSLWLSGHICLSLWSTDSRVSSCSEINLFTCNYKSAIQTRLAFFFFLFIQNKQHHISTVPYIITFAACRTKCEKKQSAGLAGVRCNNTHSLINVPLLFRDTVFLLVRQ